MERASYMLTTSTPDTTGIVAAITAFLAERQLSITETQHFLDPPTRRSYLRTVFCDDGSGANPRMRGILLAPLQYICPLAFVGVLISVL